MGESTEIAWTDHTFNPWWGCVRVSPGCEHCYAEAFAKRTGNAVWGVSADRRFFGDKHWAEPLKWNAAAEKAGERRRVFCASMADVFEDRDDLFPPRARLFALIEATPWLDWQLLTKRPQNLRRFLPAAWLAAPRANVWLGTTVEDQKRATERIPHLLATPAAVRFLSCEPLLGPVDLSEVNALWAGVRMADGHRWVGTGGAIHWVIVGGESGGGARPFDLAWARSLRKQCGESGVACFVKQMGAMPRVSERTPTAEELAAHEEGRSRRRGIHRSGKLTAISTYLRLADRKGADPTEWPIELRVREFPEVRS